MGIDLIDKFTYLHWSVGVSAYFVGFRPAALFFLLHCLFEAAENTETGMRLLDRIPVWPGGKTEPDTLLNIVGDTIAAMGGWASARALDIVA